MRDHILPNITPIISISTTELSLSVISTYWTLVDVLCFHFLSLETPHSRTQSPSYAWCDERPGQMPVWYGFGQSPSLRSVDCAQEGLWVREWKLLWWGSMWRPLVKTYDSYVEADTRENKLSKGLGGVSRSEKNSVGSLFFSKNLQEKHFSPGGILQWLGFKPGFLISSDCFTSFCSKKWGVLLLYFEKMTKFGRAEGNLALQLEKNII